MQPFQLLQPRTFDEAVELLAEDPEARPLAGGTALVLMLKQGLLRPERLINLKRIQGAQGIVRESDGGLRIGALTSIREVELDPGVRAAYPALAAACHVVANIRIRNLATVGGNVAHGDYQSDPPAMLAALDTRVRIRSTTGEREEAISSFLVSGYQTTLEPDELVTELIVPPLAATYRSRYLKFTSRSAEDRPCAGIAILLDQRDGHCADLRLVVGAVSPAPVRVVEAERLASGERITPELADALGVAAAGAVEPVADVRGSVAYKRHLVRVLVRRTVLELTAEEGQAA